ncbi:MULTISPECIES: YdiK family protein [Bacillaceae]|uniref:YdiK family protein n=1 Tax=Bacillaceae TaxID=186817 RepID=UPI001BDDDBEF|nr:MULTISPECIES: YdiK family protein [Bacillaceae]MDX8363296.1 YdiK family protein [Cytobacillus sp. IB215316]
MRRSPLFFGFIYSFIGIVFTYLAIQSAQETIWNFPTLILSFVATLDFGVAIRMFIFHNKLKKIK